MVDSANKVQRWIKKILVVSSVLAVIVVVFGAYVRLKDAGLGCPDWPGCYGQLIGVPDSSEVGVEVDPTKAWIEVTHRYIAGILGLLILAMTILSFSKQATKSQRLLANTLLVLVIIQAGLGALTVTELLKPVIVTAHLLGGLSILAVFAAFLVRTISIPGFSLATNTNKISSKLLSLVAIMLVIQIALGGWVSSNYAGLACGVKIMTCNQQLVPTTDFSAFSLSRELGFSADGKPITQQALAMVNYVHRIVAVILTISIIVLSIFLIKAKRFMQAGLLIFVLSLQLTLGMYIVMTGLPLLPSLLHNFGAACVCIVLAAITATPHKS